MVCYAAILKMDNQQVPTVPHSELCSMLCGSLDGRGVWGEIDTCMCMAEIDKNLSYIKLSYIRIFFFFFFICSGFCHTLK